MSERQQQASVELGVFALSGPDVEMLLNEAVATVGRELGAEFASYLELDTVATAAVLRASYGWQLDGEPVVAPLADTSPAAQALRAGGPILVEHVNGNGDGRSDFLRAHGVVSSAAVLVGAGLERPFGVLSAHSTHPNAFHESDLLFLGSVAHVLAAALVRAQASENIQRLAEIVDSSSDAIIGKTLDGVVTSWNAAAEAIYGYAADEAMGRPIEFIVPADRRPELASLLERLRNGERIRNLETVRIRKDGTQVEVALSLSPIVDAAGRPVGSSAIARDISERTRAQTNLRRSEVRYRDLFENASDLIAVVDLNSRLTDVNRAFAMALGYGRDELIGRPISDFVPEESRALLAGARDAKLASERDATVYEHDLLARDGSRIRVEVASRLLFEGGQPAGTEAICRDVSERGRLEEQLRVAHKMEAVGQLAGGIAHDFNNLLLIIRTCSQLLLERIDEPGLRADVTEIDRAAERATELTRQLLAFGRRQVLQPQATNLHEQLGDMIQLLQRTIGENVAVDYQPGTDVPIVRVDRSQLNQVVLNLAVNARDAMPDGGTLTIRTAAVSDPDGAPAGPYALLEISDTGAGIPLENQQQIFDPFYTTKEHGSGLGLSSMHGIVTQSGGHVAVSSVPGEGAAFRIYLPAVIGPAQPTGRPFAAPATPDGQETILLVEDEETIRRTVASALRGYGYTVCEARNGEEALLLLASTASQADLLLSDVVMDGINGRELADRVRARKPGIPVLLTSGYPADTFLGDRPLGDTAYIQKPYVPHELATRIREVLDS